MSARFRFRPRFYDRPFTLQRQVMLLSSTTLPRLPNYLELQCFRSPIFWLRCFRLYMWCYRIQCCAATSFLMYCMLYRLLRLHLPTSFQLQGFFYCLCSGFLQSPGYISSCYSSDYVLTELNLDYYSSTYDFTFTFNCLQLFYQRLFNYVKCSTNDFTFNCFSCSTNSSTYSFCDDSTYKCFINEFIDVVSSEFSMTL